MHVFRNSILLVTGLVVFGCSRTLILLSPEDLYFLGNHYLEKENYRAATDQFERILTDYPASEFAIVSQFKLAESYFYRKNYSKSAMEFEIFLEFNPGHKLAPQAQYYLAMSTFNRIINPERDISAALQAKESLERFLNRYRDHPDRDQVQIYLSQVKDHLQMHEVEVGKAYYRMRYYNAAIQRLEPVLETEVSDEVRQQALYYLARSSLRMDDKEKGTDYLLKASRINTGNKYQRRSARMLQRIRGSS